MDTCPYSSDTKHVYFELLSLASIVHLTIHKRRFTILWPRNKYWCETDVLPENRNTTRIKMWKRFCLKNSTHLKLTFQGKLHIRYNKTKQGDKKREMNFPLLLVTHASISFGLKAPLRSNIFSLSANYYNIGVSRWLQYLQTYEYIPKIVLPWAIFIQL